MKKFLIAVAFLLLLSLCLTGCGLTVPRPEVKEGEFDFSITYELNGEVKTFSAVYVCEYDGTNWSLDGGHSRKWEISVQGDYEGDDYGAKIGTAEDGAEIWLYFGLYPQYFMGDPNVADRGIPEPELAVSYPETFTGEVAIVNGPEDIEKLFGAKIISYQYAAPIANTFGLFK